MAAITTRQAKGTPLTNAEVDANFTNLNTELGQKAPLASPTLTGVPAAPTAAADTNTTQIATTAFLTSMLRRFGLSGGQGTSGIFGTEFPSNNADDASRTGIYTTSATTNTPYSTGVLLHMERNFAAGVTAVQIAPDSGGGLHWRTAGGVTGSRVWGAWNKGATVAELSAKLAADFSGLTEVATNAGTDTFAVNQSGTKRTTLTKILDWIKAQSIVWGANQSISKTGTTTSLLLENYTTGDIGVRWLLQGVSDTAITAYRASPRVEFMSQQGVPISIGNSGVPRLTINGFGNVEIPNYTKLGESSPAIKVKKLTGTTAATEGGNTGLPHGLSGAKIISLTALVEYMTGGMLPPSYLNAAGYEYSVQSDNTMVAVYNKTGNSAAILSKPFTVFITYEE